MRCNYPTHVCHIPATTIVRYESLANTTPKQFEDEYCGLHARLIVENNRANPTWFANTHTELLEDEGEYLGWTGL